MWVSLAEVPRFSCQKFQLFRACRCSYSVGVPQRLLYRDDLSLVVTFSFSPVLLFRLRFRMALLLALNKTNVFLTIVYKKHHFDLLLSLELVLVDDFASIILGWRSRYKCQHSWMKLSHWEEAYAWLVKNYCARAEIFVIVLALLAYGYNTQIMMSIFRRKFTLRNVCTLRGRAASTAKPVRLFAP